MGMLMVLLLCVLALGLVGLVVVVIAIQRGQRHRGLSDVERDYDDGSRRGER
ncbi:MAG TPA: hypothetical protein VFB89_03540 [Gemmatimonadales bacterium]|jgi:hypothetical protein|nr:hypothetical protein [Gemmatimonadales bacterium]